MPKFHLLYFKCLLDIAFSKFFDIYGDAFIKQDNRYVLAKSFTANQLAKTFEHLVIDELRNIITAYDVMKPTYFVIIGACMPKDNILLKFNSNSAFPSKLNRIVNSEYSVKYLLKEKDISIDAVKFNDACIMAFNKFFCKDLVAKHFGKEFKKNVLFITHKSADCYVMFKLLKSIFGKANCINMKTEKYADIKSPITSINDLIDNYAQFGNLNKSSELIAIKDEIKTYIRSKIGLSI